PTGGGRGGHSYRKDIAERQAKNIAAFVEGNLLGPDLDGADVVILNAPSQTLGLYGPFVLDAKGWPVPRSWRPLALGGEFAMFASRPTATALELTAIQGAWMHTAREPFFPREDQPPAAGGVLAYP